MAEVSTQYRMENTPISKLVFQNSAPLMVSTLVSSLYNLVDSMYVSRISEKALTATTVAFPLTLLLFALSIGSAVGVSSRLSRFLGEGDSKSARETGWTGVILAIISSIPFMLIGMFGIPTLFRFITSDPEVSQLGQSYSRIILLFCLGQFFASLGSRLLQSTGYAHLSMATQITGSALNCILDPIMIFGWLGCPAMGVQGAALATVASQCVAGGSATILYFVKNPALRIGRKQMRIRFDLVGEIYKVGVPVMITMAMNSVLMMIINRILEGISLMAIAFYGIYSKLHNFLFMPINGLSQGIIPVTGYFFGSKNGQKVKQAIASALKIGITVSLAGTAVFMLFPRPLMAIYNAGEELQMIGGIGLRTLALTFVPQAFVMILTNAFNAMGNGMVNMKCNMLKGILPIPLLLLLVQLIGTSWCWFAFVIADALAAGLAIVSYRKASRNTLSRLTPETVAE